jgi:hypothetical protein
VLGSNSNLLEIVPKGCGAQNSRGREIPNASWATVYFINAKGEVLLQQFGIVTRPSRPISYAKKRGIWPNVA